MGKVGREGNSHERAVMPVQKGLFSSFLAQLSLCDSLLRNKQGLFTYRIRASRPCLTSESLSDLGSSYIMCSFPVFPPGFEVAGSVQRFPTNPMLISVFLLVT